MITTTKLTKLFLSVVLALSLIQSEILNPPQSVTAQLIPNLNKNHTDSQDKQNNIKFSKSLRFLFNHLVKER